MIGRDLVYQYLKILSDLTRHIKLLPVINGVIHRRSHVIKIPDCSMNLMSRTDSCDQWSLAIQPDMSNLWRSTYLPIAWFSRDGNHPLILRSYCWDSHSLVSLDPKICCLLSVQLDLSWGSPVMDILLLPRLWTPIVLIRHMRNIKDLNWNVFHSKQKNFTLSMHYSCN